MIRDQRHMYFGKNMETPEQVRSLWEKMVVAVSAARGEDIRLHDEPDTLTAYVNSNRWVADCPACNGGIAAWPEHDKGACLDCGGVYSIEFPPAKLIEKADAVLSARKESNRHWYPDTESIERLQAESILMEGVPEDFVGIGTGKGRIGPDDLLPEFDRLLESRRARELPRGGQ